MDLALNETQQLIQESGRKFVSGACDRDVLLALDRKPEEVIEKTWKQLGELGWTAMAVPEEYGGGGNSLTDVAVLFEELGVGPVPGPLFSSAVLCARILLEAAGESTKRALLPKIASGERIFALALTEARYGWSAADIRLEAGRQGADFVLNGRKLFVHDAPFATDLLVVARIEGEAGVSVFHVDVAAPGVARRPLEGFMSGVGEVRFEGVRLGRERLICSGDKAWSALQRGIRAAVPVLCAYKVGGCKRVFEMSVNYARERTQFGQVIGRFTRVQDHVIHIVNALDAARWTTWEALWKLDTGQDAAPCVHVAKAVSSESYITACDYAHEVHAGMGVVREYGLTLHTKMSRSLYHCLGAPRQHRRDLEGALRLLPPDTHTKRVAA
jgi:alkylation response protein AidB-like acyl-CoA dehydrogenase